jgi:hypothetical protein
MTQCGAAELCGCEPDKLPVSLLPVFYELFHMCLLLLFETGLLNHPCLNLKLASDEQEQQQCACASQKQQPNMLATSLGGWTAACLIAVQVCNVATWGCSLQFTTC